VEDQSREKVFIGKVMKEESRVEVPPGSAVDVVVFKVKGNVELLKVRLDEVLI